VTATADPIAPGTVHAVPADVATVLRDDVGLLAQWESLTPLGRNEFLCWIEDAKQAATRARRIERMGEELRAGKRRPCCWAGCIHRTDKAPGTWQQAVLIDGKAPKPQ
jgi:hypothetical protein